LGAININVNFWWPAAQPRLTKTSFRAIFLSLLAAAAADGNQSADHKEPRAASDRLSPDTRRLLERMEDLVSQQYRM